MTLKETIAILWVLAYPLFFAGMAMSLNSSATRNLIEQKVESLIKNVHLGSRSVPMHILRAINKMSAKFTYQIIEGILLASVAINFASTLCMEDKILVKPLLDAAITYFGLVTALVSAHDVLLHDDKSAWSDEAKKAHVIFPFNLEMTKVFVKKLDITKIKYQNVTLKEQIMPLSARFLATAVVALATFRFGYQNHLKYLSVVAPIWMAHHNFLQLADLMFDMFALEQYGNRFEHMFGDVLNIVKVNEQHDFFGKQYQYFNHYGKPIEKLCKKLFYDKARNEYGADVASAKVSYYIGRGALVVSSLLLMDMISFHPATLASFAAYYGVHAGMACYSQSIDDFLDIPFKRAVALGAEVAFSGFLFYQPILNHTVGSHW